MKTLTGLVKKASSTENKTDREKKRFLVRKRCQPIPGSATTFS